MTRPVIVVENDPFPRLLQTFLAEKDDPERSAAIQDFVAHDIPDYPAWLAAARAGAPGLWPAEVRLASNIEELHAALPGAHAVVTESLTLGETELALAKDLKVVHKYGTVLRNIDVNAVAARGLKQLRIAETEKYAHVTYFFNGGVETPYAGEERVMVPSPKVATYDLQPEMSAREVTDKLVAAIQSKKFDAIVCNYANGDMVGHTGDLSAATRAIETLDGCIGRAVEAMQAVGGEVLITADHGNAETMLDTAANQPHTAHTLNLVPLLYIGRKAKAANGGALQDVAPTLLKMMGLPQPAEMTGKPLLEFL